MTTGVVPPGWTLLPIEDVSWALCIKFWSFINEYVVLKHLGFASSAALGVLSWGPASRSGRRERGRLHDEAGGGPRRGREGLEGWVSAAGREDVVEYGEDVLHIAAVPVVRGPGGVVEVGEA